MTIDELYDLTYIDRWFLKNIEEILKCEREIETHKKDLPIFSGSGEGLPGELMKRAKQYGFSDRQIGDILGQSEHTIREWRTQ